MNQRRSVDRWQMVVVIAAAVLAAARARAMGDAAAALSLAAPDADIVIVAPDPKRTSDELTQLLERMERADLLVGSRPIDQLKSLLGIGAGVDDHGPVIALLYESADPEASQPFDALILVPVTDPGQFLESSLDPAEGAGTDAYRVHDGRTIYARPIGSHVLLGESAQRVRAYDAAGGIANLATESLGERGSTIMNAADIVLLDRSGALARFAHHHGGAMHGDAAIDDPRLLQLHMISDHIAAWGEAMDAGIVAIDVDPLALIVRTYARLDPESDAGRLAAGGERAIEPLSALPGKPYYLAASIDQRGAGGDAALTFVADALGISDVPDWLTSATALQLAVYPSPAGLQGGILNDAVLVMHTPHAAEARDFLKQQILALRERDDGITREIDWQDAKTIKPGLVADAYEVFITNQPSELAQLQVMQSMIFGSRGWRGFVHQVDGALIMTFSQRPAVLEAALASASGQGQTLDDLPVVRAMQAYLPPHSDAQLFLGIGEILTLANQVASTFGGLVPIDLPSVDGPVEPLAMGAAVQDHAIETSLIAPASVLRIIFDKAMRSAASREPAPGDWEPIP